MVNPPQLHAPETEEGSPSPPDYSLISTMLEVGSSFHEMSVSSVHLGHDIGGDQPSFDEAESQSSLPWNTSDPFMLPMQQSGQRESEPSCVVAQLMPSTASHHPAVAPPHATSVTHNPEWFGFKLVGDNIDKTRQATVSEGRLEGTVTALLSGLQREGSCQRFPSL